MKILTKNTISTMCSIATMMLLVPNFSLAGESAVKPALYPQYHKMTPVRCDMGASLSKYIKKSRSGDTLKIYGQCNDTIIITKDDLRLIGAQNARINGEGFSSEAVVLIRGAKGTVIESLAIVNGSDQGILATQGATGILSNLLVEGHKTVGISIDRSQFEISDVEAIKNGSSGMDIYSASTVLVAGQITASQNSGDGIAINGKSFFELRGAQITANDNDGSGVSVINDSRLQIFSFPEAQGSGVTAYGNGFAGIGILGAELGVVGSQYFGSGANVFDVSNNLFGFFMPAGAILSPHATAKFQATDNQIGMLLEDGGNLLIVGGLSIQDNNVGVIANGANTVNVVSVPPNPSLVTNNQLDINAQFGSRITFDNVDVGTVVCDQTVLVRGSLVCPILP